MSVSLSLSEQMKTVSLYRVFVLSVYKPSPIGNIEQAEFLVLLLATFQGNGRFTEHIKRKLFEANRCLYVLRS